MGRGRTQTQTDDGDQREMCDFKTSYTRGRRLVDDSY